MQDLKVSKEELLSSRRRIRTLQASTAATAGLIILHYVDQSTTRCFCKCEFLLGTSQVQVTQCATLYIKYGAAACLSTLHVVGRSNSLYCNACIYTCVCKLKCIFISASMPAHWFEVEVECRIVSASVYICAYSSQEFSHTESSLCLWTRGLSPGHCVRPYAAWLTDGL